MNSKESENRLIDFSIRVANLLKLLPEDRITDHLSGQLLRSATSPALNYGEAQGAESKKDFVHKFRTPELDLDNQLKLNNTFRKLF